MVSALVGHTTLRSSTLTSWRNSRGRVRLRWAGGGGERAGLIALAGDRGAVRAELSLPLQQPFLFSVHAHVRGLPARGRGSRAGGTRTPNRRFWRPVLYQLSYCPTGRGSPGGEDSTRPVGTDRRPARAVRLSRPGAPCAATPARPARPLPPPRPPRWRRPCRRCRRPDGPADGSGSPAARPPRPEPARMPVSTPGAGSSTSVRSWCRARSSLRYWTSSAWQRRQDSTCGTMRLSAASSPSTMPGSRSAMSSHSN